MTTIKLLREGFNKKNVKVLELPNFNIQFNVFFHKKNKNYHNDLIPEN